jgi:dTDP-4-amino-4,6-dideoxygalactose transaminase
MIQTSSTSSLAVLGGTPRFSEYLHVGRPNIGSHERFLERARLILERRWLSNQGPFVQEFEQRLAGFLGVRHCIAMCNGTVALEIATRALNLKGEVIVPSFTFIATAHCLQWQEITPVFGDIDPRTHNLDPDRVEAMITPKTTGIMGVHLWGRPCDIERLEDLASRRNLRLLFDASHALGATHGGRMIGQFGDCEVFSFHATKFMNTFEGGTVVTNNDDLARKIRLMKNFGFAGYDRVIYIGTNGKMSEVAAAMGLTNLESLDYFVTANRRNHDLYRQGLAGLPGISLVAFQSSERNNFQYVVLEVNEAEAGLSRDELLKVLHAERVLARRYFWPGCHRMEPYRSHFPHASLLLPHTEEVARRVLVLPTGTAIGPEEIEGICDIIRTALAQAGAVRTALSADKTEITVPGQVLPTTRTAPGLRQTRDGLISPHQDANALGAASKKLA